MKQLWINLPVKDIEQSRVFFKNIGFKINPRHENSDEAVGLMFGKNKFIVMLFPEKAFEKFCGNSVGQNRNSTEVLFSIDAQSREEVDEFMRKVELAGGEIYREPQDSGMMYGAGFIDLDGHRWNVVYMGEQSEN